MLGGFVVRDGGACLDQTNVRVRSRMHLSDQLRTEAPGKLFQLAPSGRIHIIEQYGEFGAVHCKGDGVRRCQHICDVLELRHDVPRRTCLDRQLTPV